jgi:hypothetical protein
MKQLDWEAEGPLFPKRVREDVVVATVDVDLQLLFFEGAAVSADSQCDNGILRQVSHSA